MANGLVLVTIPKKEWLKTAQIKLTGESEVSFSHGKRDSAIVNKLFPKELSLVKVVAPIKYKRSIVQLVEETGKVEPIAVDPRLGADHMEIEARRNQLESLKNDIGSFLNRLDEKSVGKGLADFETLSVPEDENEVISYISEKFAKTAEAGKEIISSIESLLSRINELEGIESTLEKFTKLGLDSRLLRQGAGVMTTITVGTVVTHRATTLSTMLQEVTDGKCVFITTGYSKEERIALVIYFNDDEEAVAEKFRDNQFTPIALPEEIDLSLDEISREITESKTKVAELEEQLKEYSLSNGGAITALLEAVDTELYRINEVELKMKRTKTQLILWGWIPPEEQDVFKAKVQQGTENSAIIEFRSEGIDKSLMPSYTPERNIHKPARGIVTAYGVPSHEGIDPIGLVTIAFTVFFGIMFADILDGFLLMLIGIWARRKKATGNYPREGLFAYLYSGSTLFIYMGISSMFFGLLMGSFGGDETILWEVPILVKIFGQDLTTGKPGLFPTWTWFYHIEDHHGKITVERDYTFLLLFSFAMGGITILTGLILDIIQKTYFRHSDLELVAAYLLPAVYVVPLIVAALRLPGLAIGLVAVILIITLFVIEFKAHGFGGVMLSVDHVLALLSNTFSFGRLLAMNTIHFVFSFLPYVLLGKMFEGEDPLINHYPGHWGEQIPEHWKAYLLAMLIGRVIVVPVETVFSSLQALRLTWVEFFGKFFRGEGIPFSPVMNQRRYTVEGS